MLIVVTKDDESKLYVIFFLLSILFHIFHNRIALVFVTWNPFHCTSLTHLAFATMKENLAMTF